MHIMQVFNGGSDFNEPIKRCLDRLHTAAWANSDILLVSDGELRQPGSEIMRKLSGEHAEHALELLSLLFKASYWRYLFPFADSTGRNS